MSRGRGGGGRRTLPSPYVTPWRNPPRPLRFDVPYFLRGYSQRIVSGAESDVESVFAEGEPGGGYSPPRAPEEAEEEPQPSLIHTLQVVNVLLQQDMGGPRLIIPNLLQGWSGLRLIHRHWIYSLLMPLLWSSPGHFTPLDLVWESFNYANDYLDQTLIAQYPISGLDQVRAVPQNDYFPVAQNPGFQRLAREMYTIFFQRIGARPAPDDLPLEYHNILHAGYLNAASFTLGPPYPDGPEVVNLMHPSELATPVVLKLSPPRGHDYHQALYTIDFMRRRQIFLFPWVDELALVRHSIQLALLDYAAQGLRFPWQPRYMHVKVSREARDQHYLRPPRAVTPFRQYDLQQGPQRDLGDAILYLRAVHPADSAYVADGLLHALIAVMDDATNWANPNELPVQIDFRRQEYVPLFNLLRRYLLPGHGPVRQIRYQTLREVIRGVDNQDLVNLYQDFHREYFDYGDNLEQPGADWQLSRVMVYFTRPTTAADVVPDNVEAADEEYRTYRERWRQQEVNVRRTMGPEFHSSSSSSSEGEEGPALEVY